MKHTAERLKYTENEQLESLMKRAVWYFDKKYNKEKDPVRASFHIFRKAVDDESVLDEADLNDAERKELLRNIKLKMMPTPDKIRADVKVHCTVWTNGQNGMQNSKFQITLKHRFDWSNLLLRSSNFDSTKYKYRTNHC